MGESFASNGDAERRGNASPKTNLLYSHHRIPLWLIEVAPRDRSNRLLGSLVSDKAPSKPRCYVIRNIYDAEFCRRF